MVQALNIFSVFLLFATACTSIYGETYRPPAKVPARPQTQIADEVRSRLLQNIEDLRSRWVDLKKKKKGDGSDDSNSDANSGVADFLGQGGDGSSQNGGSGAGNGGGKSKFRPGDQFGYDENAKKSKATTPEKPKEVGDRGGQPPQGPKPPPGRKPEIFAKWWPVCFLVDPNVPEATANSIVRDLVRISAECQVNIEPFPFQVTGDNYSPDDDVTINNLQRTSCNIPEGLGVSRGSSQFIGPSNTAADKMCANYKNINGVDVLQSDVAGCAEVGQGGGADKALIDKSRGSSGEHMQLASGGVAVSILDRTGWTGAIGSHEAIGHSEMGQPNGNSLGNGIGKYDDKQKTDPAPDGHYNPEGCGFMQRAALPNDGTHVFEPDRDVYYTQERNPERRIKMGEKLFNRPPRGNPPHDTVDHPRLGGDRPGGGPSNPASVGANLPRDTGNSSRDLDYKDSPATGHKKGSQTVFQGGGSPGSFQPTDNSTDRSLASVPATSDARPDVSRGAQGSSLGYDESASKSTAGAGGSSGTSGRPLTDSSGTNSVDTGGSGGSGGTSSIGYDDNATKSTAGNTSKNGTAKGDGIDGEASDGAKDGVGGFGSAVSVFDDVQKGSEVLQDDFFKGIGKGKGEAASRAKRRGEGGRRRQTNRAVGNLYGAGSEPSSDSLESPSE